MIRPIKALSTLELEELKTLYIDYFKELNKTEYGPIKGFFERIFRDKSEAYADEMLDRLINGKHIGYVSYDYSFKEKENVMVAFIVGKVDKDNSGWISHFYVEGDNTQLEGIYKKRIALELYKALAEEFARLGVTRVATEVGKNEFAYKDLLESLDFEPIHTYDDDHVDYGKTI